MDDLISRQRLLEYIHGEPVGRLLCDKYNLDGLIEQLPPAQPEIVQCKDCKYAEYIDDVQALWCTECGQGRTVAPNDFCSYAERRTDE